MDFKQLHVVTELKHHQASVAGSEFLVYIVLAQHEGIHFLVSRSQLALFLPLWLDAEFEMPVQLLPVL